MEILDSFSAFVSDKGVSVPLGQVIILLIVNSIVLLTGKHKLGLLVTYCFVIYWGFFFNRAYFMNVLGETSWGLPAYIAAGILMIIVILVSFFSKDSD